MGLIFLALLFASCVSSEILLPPSCLDAFKSSGIQAINAIRPYHSAGLLVLNSTLDASAKISSDKLAKKPNNSSSYLLNVMLGENRYFKVDDKDVIIDDDYCKSIII